MKTHVSFFLMLSIVFINAQCEKQDDPKPNPTTSVNRPPNAFTVTAKQAVNSSDIVLSWNKVKDPDGDPLSYAVISKDTLVRGLTDTSYVIQKVGYNTTITGSVIASDNKKGSIAASFNVTTGEDRNSTITIPDAEFEKKLISLFYDDVLDGKIKTSSVEYISKLDISQSNISNLQGIEAFVNLNQLYCQKNKLINLDLSKNKRLNLLHCRENNLTRLDISNNTLLTTLDCSINKLTVIDVSKNLALTDFNCYQNDLSSLDVSKNIKLKGLACRSLKIQSLDVSNNLELETLNLYFVELNIKVPVSELYWNLTNLDISKNVKLKQFSCGYLKLKSIDVSNNPLLDSFECTANEITSLDISKNTALRYFTCTANKITNLDVSNNPRLIWIQCGSNLLTNLDLSKNPNLTVVECYNNKLTTLDISKCPSVNICYCYQNQIKVICLASLSQVRTSGWSKDATAEWRVCQ